MIGAMFLHSTLSSPPTDYPARALSTSTSTYTKSLPLFTSPEFHALISTAHSLNVRVAAHCVNPSTIKTLLSAGIDTLEHGTEMKEQLLGEIKERGVVWCPDACGVLLLSVSGQQEMGFIENGAEKGNRDACEGRYRR